jgi:hypothetical protein
VLLRVTPSIKEFALEDSDDEPPRDDDGDFVF